MWLRRSLTSVAGAGTWGEKPGSEAACFLSSPSFSPFLSSVLFSPSLNPCHRPALGQVLGIQRTKPALFFLSLPPCLFLSFLHQTEITLAGVFPGPGPAPFSLPAPTPTSPPSLSPSSPPPSTRASRSPSLTSGPWSSSAPSYPPWLFLPWSEPSGCFQVIVKVRVGDRTWDPIFSLLMEREKGKWELEEILVRNVLIASGC